MYQNNDQVTISENITAPIKSKLQAHQQKCESEERLLRNFIEHCKRTGEFDHPVLDELIKKVFYLDTASQDVLLQPETLKTALNTLEETKQGIAVSTLVIKDILKNIVETCRLASTGQSLRNLIEEIPQAQENPSFATVLKSEQLKLARYIDRLLDLAQKYGEQNTEMSGRSLAKLVGDLTYFRLYIEQHAQLTKIEQEVYWVNDPSVYLRRLNQYLDVLPETATALIHILQNAIASKLPEA